jgi:hypothetical protein
VAKSATIETSKGTIKAELFDTEVPGTVSNFEKLANSKRVKDVAQVHSILWPVDTHTTIIDFDILTGVKTVRPASAETVNIESTPSLLALPTPSDRSLEQWTTSPSPTAQDEGTPPTP